MPKTICSDCGEECEAVECDNGIGPYEYGSISAVHHDFYTGSDCCGAEVEEGGSKVVEITHQVARKDYGTDIKKGDYYRRKVERHWRKNGPSWYIVTRYIPVWPCPASAAHHNFLWHLTPVR